MIFRNACYYSTQKHGSEPSSSINGGEFNDHLSDHRLLKEFFDEI
jgi:hypothetical protein